MGKWVMGIASIILLGAILRLCVWPGRYEIRDIDEISYTEGGLCLLEGVPPGHGMAPAGPYFWTGWLYGGAHWISDLLHPDAAEFKLPLKLRVFSALNRALFFSYWDLSYIRSWLLTINFLVGLAGIYAAWRFGGFYGGRGGAVFASMLVATLPLFVEYGAMARPYALSWSLLFLALAAAATARKNRVPWTCLFLGMAIGTRIEAIVLFPLIWWEIADATPGRSGVIGPLVKVTVGSLAVAAIVSPWMLADLLGMIRAIGTIAVFTPPQRQTAWLETLREFVLGKGLLLLLPALVLGMVELARRSGRRVWNWMLVLYLILMLLSIFKATGYGLHHKGPQIIAIIAGGVFMFSLLDRRRGLAIAVALAVSVWPLILSCGRVIYWRSGTDPGNAPVAWVEKYVPPGTRVYTPKLIRTLLPTKACSASLWNEVIAPNAYIRKFDAGEKRFGINEPRVSVPRAMSEENLIQDRGNLRRWFILGSLSYLQVPRFDVSPRTSVVFGDLDPIASFEKTGGVLMLHGDYDETNFALGSPAKIFPGGHGTTTRIFISKNVRMHISAVAFVH